MIKKELTYNDISLFSREISKVRSRFSEDIILTKNIKFENKTISTGIFMSAPMVDVTGFELQVKLLELGQIPIIHRFMTAEEQIGILDRVLSKTNYNENYIYSYSIGINDYKEKLSLFDGFLHSLNCDNLNFLICIDTANGASYLLEEPINEINNIKNKYKDCLNIEILTGNVVTKEASSFLYDLGVKFIRCGISAGSVCSTSVVTGVYRPPVSMLIEISEWRDIYAQDLYIIADGGIKGTDDILKAIACGADFIMSGRLFAGYDESNSPIIQFIDSVYKNYIVKYNNINEYYSSKTITTNNIDNVSVIGKDILKKYYRGMASEEMALLNNKVNNLNKEIIPEGVTDYVDYRTDLDKDLINIFNSIRSSMSYMNALNLFDYQMNCEIIEISENSNKLRKPDIYNRI